MHHTRLQIPPPTKILRKIKTFFNLEPSIQEAHRNHLLLRAKICFGSLVFFYPFTILPYVHAAHPEIFNISLVLTIGGMFTVVGMIFLSNHRFFVRFYHLPSLIVAVICSFTTSSVVYLEGYSQHRFLFPYFLTAFGYAILLPNKFLWTLVSLAVLPISYTVTEILISPPTPRSELVSNLISLTDGAILAIIANQILFSLFLRDKRNQLKLQAANEKLVTVAKQVAHDMASPLSSLQFVVRFWRENQKGVGGGDYFTLLDLGIKRLISISNDLLQDHRGKGGRVAFSLHRVLDELIGEHASAGNSVTIKKVYGEAIACVGNRDRIQRAFGNILKNSIEAVGGKGEITVKTWVEDSRGVVAISDTGPGMPPEVLAKVLKGGYTEGKAEGHGIGMTVVREVIEEHRGTLHGESQTGYGTTFRINLPLPGSEALKDAEKVEEGTGSFEMDLKPKEQIVVIDDDPSAQLQWELIFRKMGFEPLVYESYEEFERKKGERPTLRTAIIDYHYDNSETDGFQIIDHLRRQGYTNLYLCTGEYWKAALQKKAKALNVPICPKPIPKVVVKASGNPPPPFEKDNNPRRKKS